MDISTTVGTGSAIKKNGIRTGWVKSSPWFRAYAFMRKREKTLWGIVLILPAIILLWQFSYFPFLKTVFKSFYLTNIKGEIVAACGTDIYVNILKSGEFANSLKVTCFFVLMTVFPSVTVAVLLAALCRKRLPGGKLIDILFSMPVAVSSTCVTMVFMSMLDPSMGIINEMFHLNIKWYQESIWALPSVALVVNFSLIAMDFIFLISAIRAIPNSYYESVALDGADGFKVFFRITLPSISPTIFFLLVINVLQAFQAFGPINIMTKGGPAGATNVLSYSIYNDAFYNYQFSFASAKSVLLFLLLLGVTLMQMKMEKKRVFYQ